MIYQLTKWDKVLLEELVFAQLVKKFAVFYGNLRFITTLTAAHNWTLSCPT
jgi:hypothetical protein